MPFVGELGGKTALILGNQYGAVLKGAGNLEFNNPGGLLLPISDYGVVFGLLYWCIFGFVVATIYRSFKRYEVLGIFVYPIIFVGLLLLSQIMYLSDGRTFPSLAFLGLAVVIFSQRKVSFSSKHRDRPNPTIRSRDKSENSADLEGPHERPTFEPVPESQPAGRVD
jgi:hypothetical protein